MKFLWIFLKNNVCVSDDDVIEEEDGNPFSASSNSEFLQRGGGAKILISQYFQCECEVLLWYWNIFVMVVPGESLPEMREGKMVSSDGGGAGDLYGGGGGEVNLYEGGGGEHDLYGGELLGCGDDDEIFLLPLTALAMEADDLRWTSLSKSFSPFFKCLIVRQDLSLAGRGLFLSPASEKTFWLSE